MWGGGSRIKLLSLCVFCCNPDFLYYCTWSLCKTCNYTLRLEGHMQLHTLPKYHETFLIKCFWYLVILAQWTFWKCPQSRLKLARMVHNSLCCYMWQVRVPPPPQLFLPLAVCFAHISSQKRRYVCWWDASTVDLSREETREQQGAEGETWRGWRSALLLWCWASSQWDSLLLWAAVTVCWTPSLSPMKRLVHFSFNYHRLIQTAVKTRFPQVYFNDGKCTTETCVWNISFSQSCLNSGDKSSELWVTFHVWTLLPTSSTYFTPLRATYVPRIFPR